RADCRHAATSKNRHQAGRLSACAWKSIVTSTPVKLGWSAANTNEPTMYLKPELVLHENSLLWTPPSGLHASQERLTPGSAEAREPDTSPPSNSRTPSGAFIG